jgi:hypothetical protein
VTSQASFNGKIYFSTLCNTWEILGNSVVKIVCCIPYTSDRRPHKIAECSVAEITIQLKKVTAQAIFIKALCLLPFALCPLPFAIPLRLILVPLDPLKQTAHYLRVNQRVSVNSIPYY